MKINNELFAKIVSEVLEIHKRLPHRGIDVIAEMKVAEHTYNYGLDEDETGDLLFQVSYAVMNKIR